MRMKTVMILILGLLIAMIVGAVAALYFGSGFDPRSEEPYYAVQMENGDLYFGKVSYFPKFSLKEAYIVQSVEDPTSLLGSSLRIVPLNQATIWSANKINLNKDKVLSISEVNKESQ